MVEVFRAGTPTAKTWFTEEWQAPGITVEIGDETDAGRFDRLATAAAEALMVLFSDGERDPGRQTRAP